MVKLFLIGLTMPMMMTTNKRTILELVLPQRIIAVLADAGVEARFCGGVVRDMMLGVAIKPMDVDMASPLPPEKASVCLAAAGCG